jgi:hypothetical protein
MGMRRRIAIALVMALTLFGASGCSIYMEASRPDYKDVNIAQVGVPRQTVIHDFGMPEMSYQDKQGRQVDVFKLAPGAETSSTRTGVTSFLWVADVLTLGLFEVIGTPYAMITKPEVRTYVITYKSDDTIEKVENYAEGETIGKS